jgi:hypothetical protein
MTGTQAFKGIRIAQDGARLVIRWPRLRRLVNGIGDVLKEGILLVIGLAFFGFPASAWIPRLLRADWAAFQWTDLFVSPFLIVGALALYRSLTVLFNRDLILVTQDEIRVRGRPLPPWDMETPTIPRNEIARVEAKVRALSATNRRQRAGVTLNYDVVALLHDGTTRTIIGGSTAAELAHYVANEIAKFLGMRR